MLHCTLLNKSPHSNPDRRWYTQEKPKPAAGTAISPIYPIKILIFRNIEKRERFLK
jgi:hypothetical protein